MKLRIKLRHLVLFGVSLLCIVSALIIYGSCQKQINELDHQMAAESWSPDGGYSQVSVFYRDGSGFTAESIIEIRHNIDAKLTEASIEGSYEERTWLDTYCSSQTLTLSTDSKKTSENTVYAVGGDFFQFHPLHLIAGSYFSESDLMHDLIVVDRLTAWNLFGSTDCVGMGVNIGGNPYIICGVVEPESGGANEIANDNTATAYMAFDALGPENTAHCYEALLPNPIPDFACDIVEKVLGTYDSKAQFVENTNRFALEREFTVLKNMPQRSMQTAPVVFPYWENASRLTETRLAFSYVGIMLILLFPFVCIVILLIVLWRHRKWRFADMKNKIKDNIYSAQSRKAQRKRKNEEPKARIPNEQSDENSESAADACHDSELSGVR